MAWTTPMTAITGTTFTAAQFNTHVRDNLLETAVAKATTSGQLFVSTTANALAARTPVTDAVATSATTSSTSYTDLTASPGPAATVTSGSQALVFISARLTSSVDTTSMFASFAISGATTNAADDRLAIEFQTSGGANRAFRGTAALLVTGLTPGSNTFTMKYRVSGGGATGTGQYRQISVLPF